MSRLIIPPVVILRVLKEGVLEMKVMVGLEVFYLAALLRAGSTPVRSKPTIVCSAGGRMVLGRALFLLDWATSRAFLLAPYSPVRSKPTIVYSAGGM